MVRKGNYTIYKGQEYRFVKEQDSSISLISNNIKDLENGFNKYSDDVFIKSIPLRDLKEAYYIHPYALFKGIAFDVIVDEKSQKANLGTTDVGIAKKLKFDRTDKYYYEKWVPIEEVQLFEEREKIKIE